MKNRQDGVKLARFTYKKPLFGCTASTIEKSSKDAHNHMYLKEQLILILNHSRKEMQNAIELVDPTLEIYPSWKLKELIAHLSGWDQCVAEALESHLRGTSTSMVVLDTDTFNQQSVAARESLSYQQARADWDAQRQNLLQVIEQITEEKFQAPAMFPWGQVGAVEDIVRGFAAHERRHAEELHRLIRLAGL